MWKANKTPLNSRIANLFQESPHLKGVFSGRLVVVNQREEPWIKIFRTGIHRIGCRTKQK